MAAVLETVFVAVRSPKIAVMRMRTDMGMVVAMMRWMVVMMMNTGAANFDFCLSVDMSHERLERSKRRGTASAFYQKNMRVSTLIIVLLRGV